MKKWLSDYYGFLALLAGILILGSWIFTSTLQKDYESLKTETALFSSEIRIVVYLNALEGKLATLQSRIDSYTIESSKTLGNINERVSPTHPPTEEQITELNAKRRLAEANEIEANVMTLLENSIDSSQRIIESIQYIDEQLYVVTDRIEITEKLKELSEEAQGANAVSTERKKDFLSIVKSFFGPDFIEKVSEKELIQFEEKTKDILLLAQVGDLYIRDMHKRLREIQRTVYEEMEIQKTDSKIALNRVENITIWLYILGTFFAFLSKLGEYYKEHHRK
ncbi:MAG: hypothetical protein CMI67_22545 [Pelagibaca sp.]|nr:hypothetical protein [Pelagibaca sp.]